MLTSENRQVIQARSSCGPNDLYRLLGRSVTDVVVASKSTLRLSFSNGDTLSMIDDTDQYESFVISFNQVEIVV